MTNNNQTPIEAFENVKIDIQAKLLTISNRINAIDSKTVNWGHVGSAKHVDELLKEIMDFYGA